MRPLYFLFSLSFLLSIDLARPSKLSTKENKIWATPALSTKLERKKTDPAHLDIDHETKEIKQWALLNFTPRIFFFYRAKSTREIVPRDFYTLVCTILQQKEKI